MTTAQALGSALLLRESDGAEDTAFVHQLNVERALVELDAPWFSQQQRVQLADLQARARVSSYEAGPTRLLLVELHGERVAFTVLTRSGQGLHIVDLCVAPGRRGVGIGSWLLTRLLDLAELDGLCVTLTARAGGAAERWYRRHGFQVVASSATDVQMRRSAAAVQS